MTEKKKKRKNKRQSRYPSGIAFASVFAPIFPNHMGTPLTTHDAPVSAPPGDPPVQGGPVESVIPASRRRVMHEMRMVVGNMMEALSSESDIATLPGGPGFAPADGKSSKYDFAKSPGLGFRSELGWKLWRASVEIMPRNPTMTVTQIINAASNRTGVRFGQIDPGEIKLLEMGIQWYLSNPGR